MRALVVYESMFGSTRSLAERIADVLNRGNGTATVTTAADAPRDTAGYDLVVVGAPTHAHGLPRASSRTEAVGWAADPAKSLTLEPSATAGGVRDWLKTLQISGPRPTFAAFSTRVDIARILAGDAAAAIERRLRALNVHKVERECFLVTTSSHLVDGELERAAEWAARLPALAAVPA